MIVINFDYNFILIDKAKILAQNLFKFDNYIKFTMTNTKSIT